MSRIASIATANGRKWSFGNRYRRCRSGAGHRSDCQRCRPEGLPVRAGLSAWIGLVPKQNSSGGKERLGNISKRGETAR